MRFNRTQLLALLFVTIIGGFRWDLSGALLAAGSYWLGAVHGIGAINRMER